MKMEIYPQKRIRELEESEKQEIREYIRKGNDNIYKLATKYKCSSSQIAGIKGRMKF